MTSASRGSALGRGRRLLVFAVALFLLAPVLPGSAQTTQEKLDRAKRRLKEIRKELTVAQARLDELTVQVKTLTRQISVAYSQYQQLQGVIREAKRSVRVNGRAVEELQSRLDERARRAYISGPGGLLEALFGADTLTELSDRVAFLDVLNRADSDVTAGMEVEQELLRRQQATLAQYLADQEALLEDLRQKEQALNRAWREQASVTAEVEEKMREARTLVKDLEAQRRRELLAALRPPPGAGPPLSADGPFYWCPVDPPRSYIDDFGFPRVGHTHQGNDIFAPSGTPIRAPFNGVAEEGSGGLAGLYVRVHADANADYVFNAHLSRFAGVDGKRVTAGQVIGYVGNTGNAISTPPHNHFEYHPGGGRAVSPYLYLNEVCGVGGRG